MKRSPVTHRLLFTLIACVVVFSLLGFFVLPPLIKAQGEKRLSAELGRSVSLGSVRLNPFALSLTVRDVTVQEKEGSTTFVGWRRLYVRFDALASLSGDWVLGAIELEGFHGNVVVNHDGSLNFSDLLAKYTKPSTLPTKPGRPIRIGRLNVSDARVDFEDRSLKHPFATQVGPLTFALTDFRTVGDRGAPYHFEAVTDAGERLEWKGTLSADPLESTGEFNVENLVLKKYTPYFEPMTEANLADGTLTVRGRYVADLDPNKRSMTLAAAELHLRGLKLVERASGRTAAEVKALDVTGGQADAFARKASAERIEVTGGHLFIRREKDGSVNLIGLLKPADAVPSPPGAVSAPGAGGLPQLVVGEVAVRDSAVDVADLAMPHPAQLSLERIQFSLKNFSLKDGSAMPMHLSFDWAPKGAVDVDGTLGLEPAARADLAVKVVALDLLPLSPYLEQQVNVRITQGAVSTDTSLHASMSAGGLAGTLEGDVSVERFGLVDAAQNKGLAGFSLLAFKGMKVGTAPRLDVVIKQVDVVGPYARVRIEADKSLNISSLVAPSGPSPSGHSSGADRALPQIEVGRVAISAGDFSFTDLSVEPNVHVSLSGFAGTLSGLSSERMARADVELKGLVDGEGPVAITGKLDPLGPRKYVGLKIGATNVDLLFLSPYSGRFAGYELARGQLGFDSSIRVDGDAVDATNVVTLRQFTFGAATSSPDATHLPVRLGVALLKDTDGNVVIDLPVQGSMADPTFRVGKVVLRVVVNLLTKAAVSPFSLIGSMFGGGGDELAFQEFAPGSRELQATELPKLETLSKALANRPALSLALEGGYDPAADTYALKRIKLEGLLRRTIWEERRAASPDIPPPDQMVISPEANAAMVKKLFDAKFPPGTRFGTPLPLPPPVAPAPPPPPPGFFRHLVAIVTFKGARDHRAMRKEEAQLAAQHADSVAKAVAAGLSLDEMTGRLAESMEVTTNDLAGLASARAEMVRNHLIEAGHVSPDRLFLTRSTDPSRQNKGPRVLLSLQ